MKNYDANVQRARRRNKLLKALYFSFTFYLFFLRLIDPESFLAIVRLFLYLKKKINYIFFVYQKRKGYPIDQSDDVQTSELPLTEKLKPI